MLYALSMIFVVALIVALGRRHLSISFSPREVGVSGFAGAYITRLSFSSAERPAAYVGSCKACKGGVRVVGVMATVGAVGAHICGGYALLTKDREVLLESRGGYIAGCRCGGRAVVRRVEGKVSKIHICGAKCMASKGPSCECSCGGANHGASYL